MNYLAKVNSTPLYFVVGAVLLFVACGCLWFIVRSYKAGIKIGMKKEVLKKAITSSAFFTVLPAVSILLGVIALSGSLGVPTAWMRLSVVGNLSYEAIAAESAAQAMGATLDSSVLTPSNLVTIIAVMTTGICWGILCTIFLCKKYSTKCQKVLSKGSGKGKKPYLHKGAEDLINLAYSCDIALCSEVFLGFQNSNSAAGLISHKDRAEH